MTDSIIIPSTKAKASTAIPPQGSGMNPQTPSATGTNPLNLDLGDFKLSNDECKRASGSGSLVQGLEFHLFRQCSEDMNTPLLRLTCEMQTKDGITWDLKAETGEISTNCPNSNRTFLKKETMTLEVSLSAVALHDNDVMDFLEGRKTAPNGNLRAYGHGAIKTYIAVLVDRESQTAAIYPHVQYVPSSIQVKRTFDSEPTSKVMFTVSKADLGDGDQFFYEVRSIAPKALPA